jgi:hypothetical protein
MVFKVCKPFCGAPDAEGHHSEYAKPYDVFWLYRQHHVNVHKLRITLILPATPRLAAVSWEAAEVLEASPRSSGGAAGPSATRTTPHR